MVLISLAVGAKSDPQIRSILESKLCDNETTAAGKGEEKREER
jgi:hypothetical protein